MPFSMRDVLSESGVPYYVHCGSCADYLANIPDNSIDAIVTDPPYGLKFMGNAWDYNVPTADAWRDCLRVLKPGGHMLAFAGTRTQHRMAVNIEDAGFEVRDLIAWVYGSGFPKSLYISKALDGVYGRHKSEVCKITGAPVTPDAIKWNGWGTALKPAFEPITVARKPIRGTVAANVLQYGTGGINIDASRVPGEMWVHRGVRGPGTKGIYGAANTACNPPSDLGRFPANFIHDGEVPELGSAARFFYCAKASSSERREYNNHPTVKPLALMRYLCKLITPPGGVVLDPYTGSGSTGLAALQECFYFLGVERDADSHATAVRRIDEFLNGGVQ